MCSHSRAVTLEGIANKLFNPLVVSAEHCKMLKGVNDPNFHTKSNPNPDLLSLSVALRNLNETHFTWDFLPHPQCLPFVEHHEKLPSTTNPTVQIRAAEETEGETAWKTKQTVKKKCYQFKIYQIWRSRDCVWTN